VNAILWTCGSIVYGAFGARGFTFQDALFRIFKRTWNGRKIYHLPLPHPSPRCRIWNSAENILRARAALDKLVTL
jgi:uracil-DNA glycosylase